MVAGGTVDSTIRTSKRIISPSKRSNKLRTHIRSSTTSPRRAFVSANIKYKSGPC